MATTSSGTPARSLSIALGTSGSAKTAPGTSDDLIAIVSAFSNGLVPPHAQNPGGAWQTVTNGSVADPSWGTIDVFRLPAGSPVPANVTFQNFGGNNLGVQSTIAVLEVAHASGVEIVKAGGMAAAPSSSPWSISTGTGTASTTGGLPIVVDTMADFGPTPVVPSGYTNILTTFLAGDGYVSFGGTTNVLYGPLTTSTAVSSTTVMWSGAYGAENMAAMKILVKPTSATGPAPTAAPNVSTTTAPAVATAAPTAAPTPPPTSNGAAQANGVDQPASFRPYASNSIFNRPVCGAVNNNCTTGPTFLSNSAAIVAAQFPGGQNPDGVRSNEAGTWDGGHPLYFASASDPVINLVCNQYCGSYPSTMYIPAKARPSGGTDAHMVVIQPDGTEMDFWATYGSPGSNTTWTAPHDMQTRDWQARDTLTAGNVAVCGNFFSSSGLGPPPIATAADFCGRAGIVTAAELVVGQINHAIFVGSGCGVGFQWPANHQDNTCSSGIGPPMGGREWYDVPCATTQANGALQPWEKGILCALNIYGGYFGDTGNGGANYTGGVGPQLEGEEPFRAFNGTGTFNNSYTSPFAALASQGWSSISIPNVIGSFSGNRWQGPDPWHPSGVNFPAHIHWLAPCSAQGTC